MNCESCAFYVYDEDYDEYLCTANMDQDDYAHLMLSDYRQCPFWRNGDEYAVVRHQILGKRRFTLCSDRHGRHCSPLPRVCSRRRRQDGRFGP